MGLIIIFLVSCFLFFFLIIRREVFSEEKVGLRITVFQKDSANIEYNIDNYFLIKKFGILLNDIKTQKAEEIDIAVLPDTAIVEDKILLIENLNFIKNLPQRVVIYHDFIELWDTLSTPPFIGYCYRTFYKTDSSQVLTEFLSQKWHMKKHFLQSILFNASLKNLSDSLKNKMSHPNY